MLPFSFLESESSDDSSDEESFAGVEFKIEGRRRRHRYAETEIQEAAVLEEEEKTSLESRETSMLLSVAIIISACVLALLGGGDPTPFDDTLRIIRDEFDGTTNLLYLSTRYNFESQFRTDPDTLVILADALLPGVARHSSSVIVTIMWRGLPSSCAGSLSHPVGPI